MNKQGSDSSEGVLQDPIVEFCGVIAHFDTELSAWLSFSLASSVTAAFLCILFQKCADKCIESDSPAEADAFAKKGFQTNAKNRTEPVLDIFCQTVDIFSGVEYLN